MKLIVADFLHANKYLRELNGHGQLWVCPFRSQDSMNE